MFVAVVLRSDALIVAVFDAVLQVTDHGETLGLR